MEETDRDEAGWRGPDSLTTPCCPEHPSYGDEACPGICLKIRDFTTGYEPFEIDTSVRCPGFPHSPMPPHPHHPAPSHPFFSSLLSLQAGGGRLVPIRPLHPPAPGAIGGGGGRGEEGALISPEWSNYLKPIRMISKHHLDISNYLKILAAHCFKPANSGSCLTKTRASSR